MRRQKSASSYPPRSTSERRVSSSSTPACEAYSQNAAGSVQANAAGTTSRALTLHNGAGGTVLESRCGHDVLR